MTVVGNAGPGDYAAVAETTPAGAMEPVRVDLGLAYPRDVFSLSHVALPFPMSDGLYGMTPIRPTTSASGSARWRRMARPG